MCGSETFAMLVSSSSMNVAIVTVIAMSQGLMTGAEIAGTAGAAGGSGVGVATGLKETGRSQESHAIIEATVRSHMPVRRHPRARGPQTKGERTRQKIVA